LKSGHNEEAVRVLDLLSDDPDSTVRNEARFRRSKLMVSQGSTTEAAVLLRRIIDEKPDAAPVRIELAQLLDKMGDKDGAWRQLRAAQAIGLPPEVARIVDRYSEALRSQRPMGASLEIALAPDSNISRATRSNTVGTVIGDFQIDKDSKAKSGTGIALQGQAFRRFAIGRDNSLLIRATGFSDLYLKGRYNDVAVDVAAGPELQWGRNRLSLEAGATQRWYGQEPFLRSARIGATWTRQLGSVTQLRVVAAAALVDNRVNDLEDGKTYFGSASVERALSSTTGIALTLGGNRRSLKDPGYSTIAWRAGLTVWRDIGRATITADAEYGRLRADERLALFPEKRSDHSSRITLGATFRQLTWRGFAPITRLVFERNKSTIEFYDYKRMRSEIGIVRAF
jgi:hypothetical protein